MNGVLFAGQGALGGGVPDEIFRRLYLVPVVLVFHIDVVPGLGAIMHGSIPFVLAGCVCNEVQQMIYFLLRISNGISRHKHQCENCCLDNLHPFWPRRLWVYPDCGL